MLSQYALLLLHLQMPGVNLPASQVSYYLFTLLVCGILHEIGHAIAAVRYENFIHSEFGRFSKMFPANQQLLKTSGRCI